jgi:hypothetical protein
MAVTPQKKTATKPGATKTAAAAAASETKSKADVFDSAKAQGQTDDGKYEMLLVEAVMQDAAPDGSQSARFAYEVANEGDFKGNRLVQFYSLWQAGTTEDNPIPGRGIEFLKKDLAILGHRDFAFDDLEAIFDELSEQKPGVVATKKQSKDGQYQNVFLGGLAEDSEIIEAYRESRGF